LIVTNEYSSDSIEELQKFNHQKLKRILRVGSTIDLIIEDGYSLKSREELQKLSLPNLKRILRGKSNDGERSKVLAAMKAAFPGVRSSAYDSKNTSTIQGYLEREENILAMMASEITNFFPLEAAGGNTALPESRDKSASFLRHANDAVSFGVTTTQNHFEMISTIRTGVEAATRDGSYDSTALSLRRGDLDPTAIVQAASIVYVSSMKEANTATAAASFENLHLRTEILKPEYELILETIKNGGFSGYRKAVDYMLDKNNYVAIGIAPDTSNPGYVLVSVGAHLRPHIKRITGIDCAGHSWSVYTPELCKLQNLTCDWSRIHFYPADPDFISLSSPSSSLSSSSSLSPSASMPEVVSEEEQMSTHQQGTVSAGQRGADFFWEDTQSHKKYIIKRGDGALVMMNYVVRGAFNRQQFDNPSSVGCTHGGLFLKDGAGGGMRGHFDYPSLKANEKTKLSYMVTGMSIHF